MSKSLSANYYQEKNYKKKTFERYQNLPKHGKEISNNMVVNVTKISQKIKTKAC